jgi:predicted AlkP superfamily pyrophosphatase or phosphodiesterase
VDNAFYSPDLGLQYSIGNSAAVTNPDFYGGVPLWQHLGNNGFQGASFFWVGSEAPVSGAYPARWVPYDESTPDSSRIMAVMEWFKAPATERPHFVSLYFSLVDSVSHEFGPLSVQTMEAAIEADRLVGQITRELAMLPIQVDLILVSDHGMVEVMEEAQFRIALDSLDLPQPGIRTVNSQTQVHLYGDNPEVLERWYFNHQVDLDNMTILRRADTPSDWHYGVHSHIGELLLVAEIGYTFVDTNERKQMGTGRIRGVHGYDPLQSPELQGIFYAAGPHIQPGRRLESFSNIEVAPFIAALLQLPPLPDAESDGGELLTLVRD